MVHEARLPCACSRVERDGWNKNDKIVYLAREHVENNLRLAGFPVFHCPVKEDAAETHKAFAGSSHRVSRYHNITK